MTDIQGRTAFITGGANGIGLGTARAFARAGAKLVIIDQPSEADALAKAKAELQGITQVETYELDVRDRAGFATVAEAAESALGPVTILINNAGVAPACRVKSLTYELWDFYIDNNVRGPINGLQTFLPRMMERGLGGHIVNVSSGAGLVGAVANAPYVTTRFAVVGLSENLAFSVELKKVGINVSVLCPAKVNTNIMERSYKNMPKNLPPGKEYLAKWVEEVSLAAAKDLHDDGLDINDVGEMVLKGVREDAVYILTDATIGEYLKARHKQIFESLPNEPGPAK
jgi:NAD(P)-dependent dehydrogenase (short-subunit alcohol dehydrogenase family)